MLFTLTKNNLKIMLRDKIASLFLIAFPVILIAVLSGAFSKLLNKNYTMQPFTVGYSIQHGSNIERSLPVFIKGFKENKITLSEMNKTDGLNKVKNKSIEAYIELSDGKYTIYKNDGSSVNTTIFENSIASVMYYYDGNKTLVNYLSQKGIPVNTAVEKTANTHNYVSLRTIKADPVPNSTVYYGIVEIVFIIWFGMIIVSAIANNERRYGVTRRIELSNASSLTLFLGKLIPSVIEISIQIGIAVFLSIMLMNVNWGTSPLLSAGIILLEITATSAIGVFISIIIKNQALAGVIIFLSTFFFGFIGGSFQTYMYNYLTEDIYRLSPLYFINRTLVEFSVKGYSNYTTSCILLLLVISVLFTLLGTLAIRIRREAI